jgi:ABC-2 type transport system ATP-binding protein
MIRVRTLRKSFGRHDVLRGIDLDVAPGEVVGLIGPNGAGKTTLMSCLLGFLHPNGGTIEVDGHTNDDLTIRRRTGFVPERMNFDRGATGWEFLHYMTLLAGVPRAEAAGRARTMLDRLGIADAANRKLSQYSRGMLQRIGMCQALIHAPDYIFLDEPASGLDPNGVIVVRDLIDEQKARGAAVLLNSHQLSEVEKICDRVLFLKGGVIEQEETLRHMDYLVVAITLLAGSYDVAAVSRIANVTPREHVLITTVKEAAEIATLVRDLAASGAGIIDVRQHKADLERIFRGAS